MEIKLYHQAWVSERNTREVGVWRRRGEGAEHWITPDVKGYSAKLAATDEVMRPGTERETLCKLGSTGSRAIHNPGAAGPAEPVMDAFRLQTCR